MSDYSEHLISMAGGDGDVTERLAAIRKSNDTWLQSSVTDRNDRNTKFLLDLIEEQQARIERVEKVALSLHDPRVIQHSFHIGSDPEHDAYKAHVAKLIRTALEPTP